MVEKTLGFMFFLKHGRKADNTETYIYLRITVDGCSNELSTKRLWDPGKWNPRLGRVTGSSENSKTVNTYLDTLIQQAHKARKVLMDNDIEITAEDIKNQMLGINVGECVNRRSLVASHAMVWVCSCAHSGE